MPLAFDEAWTGEIVAKIPGREWPPSANAGERFQVHELLTDPQHLWKGPVQTIRLDPREGPAAIVRISRFPHKNYGIPCY